MGLGEWNIIEDYRPPAAFRGLCEAKYTTEGRGKEGRWERKE
jgi:hypothetical protein